MGIQVLYPDENDQDQIVWKKIIHDDRAMFGSQVYKVQFPQHPRLKNMKLVAKNQFWNEAIIREIKIVHQLAGCDHVLPLIAVVSYGNRKCHAAVYPDLSEDKIDLREQNFTIQEIQMFFAQLLEALVFIHQKGYIHNDLKPENVIYTKERQLYIIDFGAVITEGEALSADNFGGTQGYISPQIKPGKRAGAFVDLYACGVMLLEMLFAVSCVNCTHEGICNFIEKNVSTVNTTEKVAVDFMYRLLESSDDLTAAKALTHPFVSMDILEEQEEEVFV